MESNLAGSDFPFAEGILSGNTALVCGASKGIGRACALMLARGGARVIACARTSSDLDSLIQEMQGEGHEAIELDLEDIASVEEMVRDIGPIHILVNNSGGPPGGPLLERMIWMILKVHSGDICTLPTHWLRHWFLIWNQKVRAGL